MTRSDLERARAVRAWLADGPEELAPRVLETVLRDFPTTSQDRPFWAPRIQVVPLATGIAIGAATVMLVVAVIGADLLARIPSGAGATPTATPPASPASIIDRSYRQVGFAGLPARGATPSDPTHTELLESFLRPGPPYKGAAYLFADGRMIWNEYFDGGSTGWLEQRLSVEGIELVRALATQGWLLDRTQRTLLPEGLPSLLPASAWVDHAVRAYVPTEMAACIFVSNQDYPFEESPMTLTQKLAALPPAVRDLLRDLPTVVDSSASYGSDPACLALDVADARRLVRALRAADFLQDEALNRSLLEYHTVIDRPEDGLWWLSVWFEPVLPDGTITCSACG